ncbi:MAG: tRNA guanosine(34) transglycosylase Tgt [Anaerolineaceae bacterium]|nr:tRNA guanosine(34) transglycosylase Tgt [Anaerolineaceae bacterium]
MNKNTIRLRNQPVKLPVFMPDATLGIVRSVDAADLEDCHIQAVVMNTYHLMQRPGSTTIDSLGGLHDMCGWQRPIVTESGGFQAYSLIQENPKFGSITEKGIHFRPEGTARKFLLTPEKCIQLQFGYGSDVIICLDQCTHVDAPLDQQQQAVERTVRWAGQCKAEYLNQLEHAKIRGDARPKLFAVIQGGGYRDLRKACAEQLLEIGFDGFGFGGWPLDKQGVLLDEILAYTRSLIPSDYPMHALGVGHPRNVVACHDLGYALFDSAMPTRDARHGRLYRYNQPDGDPGAGLMGDWMRYIYIDDKKHIKLDKPISDGCDCLCCRRYSLGFLHHLFKINDHLFYRLATMHNLRFMSQLEERLRLRAIG